MTLLSLFGVVLLSDRHMFHSSEGRGKRQLHITLFKNNDDTTVKIKRILANHFTGSANESNE